MSVHKTFEVDVELTADDIAAVFAEMDSHEQAEFFSEIADITARWPALALGSQLIKITESPQLTIDGRYVMRLIGEYADRGER